MSTTNLFVTGTKSYLGWMPGLFRRKIQLSPLANRMRNLKDVITVGKLLTTKKTVPSNSLLLGCCMDGLPLLMTLADPAIGAILIGGDRGCGKTHQLQVMVDSACRTNQSDELQIVILTHQPDEWEGFLHDDLRQDYVQSCQAWYDHRAERTIQSLTELAEARREGQHQKPVVLFILDDFNFVEELSYEAQVNLHWLLAYGSQSNIWLVAAINSGLAAGLRYWVETFRTRIIGRVRTRSHLTNLTLLRSAALQEGSRMKVLEPGVFRVWSDPGWMTYRIPLLGN